MRFDSVIRYDVSQKSPSKISLASENIGRAVAGLAHHIAILRWCTLQQFVILAVIVEPGLASGAAFACRELLQNLLVAVFDILPDNLHDL